MYAKQAREVDIIITTALIPGKPAPRLITAEMVQSMKPGSVIVDMAAERGGNCELGPANLPAEVPFDASQIYAKNITTFLLNLVKEGQLQINLDDEIIRDTLVAREGKIVHPRLCGAA